MNTGSPIRRRMKVKTFCKYSKVECWKYFEDNVDVDVLINIREFEDVTLYRYVDIKFVTELFAPLLNYERFVITISHLCHKTITGSLVIRYSVQLRNTFVPNVPIIYYLDYYIQNYNWPADVYVLENGIGSHTDNIIYSGMRNFSLNDVKLHSVYVDCPALGFYKPVASQVYFPLEIVRGNKYSVPPKLCTSCYYFSNETVMPCAVNPYDIKLITSNDFVCGEYKSKYNE
jgi:hypothetical protein